ncbi:MAG TPA: Na+/H+ antiporter NhaA [Steroidobacteraceae bacterium]|nr:Na+/H+ antiporter NhaA [Steroidobacteraceae bacterium]
MLKPLQDFLRMESAGGLLLMAAACVALLVANSPLAGFYTTLLEMPVSLQFGIAWLSKPLLLWINDGLMAVFFLLVGLELKRELLQGHLSSVRQAVLPAIAAVGGMVVPALIYAAVNRSDPESLRGWAIPVATDIAFALGVLSLFGSRVPTALKALLLSLAIFDDLGAIIVIALFYTESLSLPSLLAAAVLIAALFALNRAGVTRPAAYVLLGIALWIAVLKSGVHATLAGVVLALFIPLRAADGAPSTGSHLEHSLHPWVAFGVLPLFAFANAGVPLQGISLGNVMEHVPLGIALGLFLGKQLGVMGFIWIAVRLRVAALPAELRWSQVYGMAVLTGIGFTMSLFVASLAFPAAPGGGLDRLGVLLGSLLSGVAGYLVLRATLAGQPRNA